MAEEEQKLERSPSKERRSIYGLSKPRPSMISTKTVSLTCNIGEANREQRNKSTKKSRRRLNWDKKQLLEALSELGLSHSCAG